MNEPKGIADQLGEFLDKAPEFHPGYKKAGAYLGLFIAACTALSFVIAALRFAPVHFIGPTLLCVAIIATYLYSSRRIYTRSAILFVVSSIGIIISSVACAIYVVWGFYDATGNIAVDRVLAFAAWIMTGVNSILLLALFLIAANLRVMRASAMQYSMSLRLTRQVMFLHQRTLPVEASELRESVDSFLAKVNSAIEEIEKEWGDAYNGLLRR